MRFSVIIPAYNEEAFIGKALDAVRLQTVPRHDVEIIVVDNHSTDNTSAVARAHGADKVILEPHIGTNIARYCGYCASSGEIVVFLDADCEPFPDWLNRIETDLSLPNVSAVSGPFDFGFRGVKHRADQIYTIGLLPNAHNILYFLFRKKAGVMIGGNCAIRRSVLQDLDHFLKEKFVNLTFWGDDATLATVISRRVGHVLFDPKLRIRSSPRRFEREGFLPLAIRYWLAYMKIYFSSMYR